MTAIAEPAPGVGHLNAMQLVDFTRFVAGEVRTGRYPFVVFDANRRWHQRLYCDQRVDIWLLSWLPDQGTQLHDHGGSAGSFTVISGVLSEAVYIHTGRDAGLLRERELAGRSVGFDAGYVHDVRNLSDTPAVSVHAYSPPLAAMTFYDLDAGELLQLATVATHDPEPGVDLP